MSYDGIWCKTRPTTQTENTHGTFTDFHVESNAYTDRRLLRVDWVRMGGNRRFSIELTNDQDTLLYNCFLFGSWICLMTVKCQTNSANIISLMKEI